MRPIYLLLNNKGGFGNKFKAKPHHSGFEKELIRSAFEKEGFKVIFVYPSEIDIRNTNYKNEIIIYTSTEDEGGVYKSYVEDVIYALKMQGAIVLPDYQYLKAHHNKVFMELLRDLSLVDEIKNIESTHYGSFDEMQKVFDFSKAKEKLVIKSAAGASSLGVRLSSSESTLKTIAKKLSFTPIKLVERVKNKLRALKHNGYQAPSQYRNKFIVQNFIPGLNNDWKVLIYGEKIYVVERPTRKNDFRASGSGKEKYLFGTKANIPDGMLEYANEIYKSYNVPMISLDIAYLNNQFYLIEMQFVAFGNSGHYYSEDYFYFENNKILSKPNIENIEEIYCMSFVKYIRSNNL